MTNRVVIGQKGAGDYGLWVSKPGVDVLTGGESEMLLSTNATAGQVMASGSVNYPGSNGTATITVSNFGFYPLIMAHCNRGYILETEWLNSTQFKITLGPTTGSATGRLYWFLMNIPGTDP